MLVEWRQPAPSLGEFFKFPGLSVFKSPGLSAFKSPGLSVFKSPGLSVFKSPVETFRVLHKHTPPPPIKRSLMGTLRFPIPLSIGVGLDLFMEFGCLAAPMERGVGFPPLAGSVPT